MRFELTPDELFLGLISMVRAVDPRMLQQGPDGFSVDFAALDAKTELAPAERLLFKFRVAMESTGDESGASLSFEGEECQLLSEALARIEGLGAWSPTVLDLSRSLRERLADPSSGSA